MLEQISRLTLEMPQETHVYLKVIAEKSGVTLKQLILNHLPTPRMGVKEKIDDSWEELFEETLLEMDPLLQRLATK